MKSTDEMSGIRREQCNILVPFKDGGISDNNGCIKPFAHNDSHISILQDNRIIEWEDDTECTCECCNEGDYCQIYSFITNDRLMEILVSYYNGEIPEHVLAIINQ